MPTKEQIDQFLSLFDGDIIAARGAIDNYEKNKQTRRLNNTAKVVNHTGEPIISIQSVAKRYKVGSQTIEALKDVSLDIYKGELIAITGSSGSGKSTLLQIIGCLDKTSSGKVVVESRDTTSMNDNDLSDLRSNTFGFVFQSFYLQPFLRLKDNLAVPAMFTDANRKEIDSKVGKLLDQVGLSERARHYPKELSGGQMQRAAIARALINNPRIILADEPTGNLDSGNSESIIDLFRDIRETLGTTVVVVTHDQKIAKQADRIIELKDGEIL